MAKEKFEKVNETKLKITKEVENVVNITQLLQAEEQAKMGIKQYENQIVFAKGQLKKLQDLIKTAYELGIKKPEKKTCPLCKGTDIPCPQCNKHLKEK